MRRVLSGAVHCGGEAAFGLPGRGVEAGDESGAEAGEEGGAPGGGFEYGGAFDWGIEDVGEELAEPVVGGHAAVDAQGAGAGAGVGFDGGDEVQGLVGDGFQGCADEVSGGAVEGEAGDEAAGGGVPVGGAEADEGGDEVDAVAAGRGFGHCGGFGGDTAIRPRPSRSQRTAAPATKMAPSMA